MMNVQLVEIPERLRRLPELATDLWWTWNTPAREVFRRLDYTLWRQTAHNPVLMLRNVAPELLQLASNDDVFLRVYDAAMEALDNARAARDTWWQHRFAGSPGSIPGAREEPFCRGRNARRTCGESVSSGAPTGMHYS